MKQKLLIVVLSLTLVVTSSGAAFASDSVDGQQIIAEYQAKVVEDVVGTENVCTAIEENRKEFIVEGESLEVEIPKEGDAEIVMTNDGGEQIVMDLPEEAEKSEAALTDDGTIVYDTREDVAVSVQMLSEENESITTESVRSMVTIKNADAEREYTFEFDLPEGYRMVSDSEYNDIYTCESIGEVYVVDETGGVISIIEKPWAKDAEGNDVETYYRVEGSKLIQVINFDEEDAFPIVADPTYSKKTRKVYYGGTRVGKVEGEVANQPTNGYKFKKTAYKEVNPNGGKKAVTSVSLGANYGKVSVGISLGIEDSSPESVFVAIPGDQKRYKIYAEKKFLYKTYRLEQWYKPSGRDAKWQWKEVSRNITITDQNYEYYPYHKEVK